MGFKHNLAVARNTTKRGAFEGALLSHDNGLAVGDPNGKAAVVSDRNGLAGDYIKELISCRVAVTVTEFDGVIACILALVAQDCDDFGVRIGTLRPCNCVGINSNVLAECREVVGVLAAHETTEEIEIGKELVDGCIRRESILPKGLAVEVGLDVSAKVLLDSVVHDGNAICGEKVGRNVAGAREVGGVVSETRNIVVLYTKSAG